MARVYLSSTYEDLVAYRSKAASVLRQMAHQVIGMEDYAASDVRPLERCLADVRETEIYVGLFAWRYGFVPPEGPGQSITELEYREARAANIPTLIFLLSEDAPWLPRFLDPGAPMDSSLPVVALRNELGSSHVIRKFVTPDDLATSIAAAVSLQVASTVSGRQKNLFVNLAHADRFEFVGSGAPDLSQGFEQARDASIMEIDLDVTSWWSTRLLLVTLLARDYTTIAAVVFSAAERFLGVAEIPALYRALAPLHPEVEAAYADARAVARAGEAARGAPHARAPSKYLIDSVLTLTLDGLRDLPGGGEPARIAVVDEAWLRQRVGAELSSDTVEAREGAAGPLDLFEIISKLARFVVALREGRVDRVIDRAHLASQVAASLLRQQLQGRP